MQVQENVHSQIKTFCTFMDEILLPNEKMVNEHQLESTVPHRSGLSFAVGRSDPAQNNLGEFDPLLISFLFPHAILVSVRNRN